MSILVIAEHDNESLKPATAHTIGAAAQLGGSTNGVRRGRLETLVVVFGNDQNAHGSVPLISILQRQDANNSTMGRFVVVLAILASRREIACVQITFASVLSLATSSATSATFTPPWRAGGSVTFNVVCRGVTSTPNSSTVRASSGFFFAFMMLGRLA